MLLIMPPIHETRSGSGVTAEDQNVGDGLVRNNQLPPLLPFPPISRGAGNVPKAPQSVNFRDMILVIQAMMSAFQAAIAEANEQVHVPVVVANPDLPFGASS
ncbi:hypothetical protein V6N13_109392 [Hibiscus sabdariffa]